MTTLATSKMHTPNIERLNTATPSTWTIVGDGAIGLWLARQIHHIHQVTLVLRNVATHQQRYHFTELNTAQYTIDFELQTANAATPIHTLILPLKSYQIVAAFKQLQPRLTNNACILLSHNGLGTIDALLPLLMPNQSLLFMTTTEGAFKPQMHQWRHTGTGLSEIAAINVKNTAAHQVINTLTALPNIVESPDILPTLWRKLAINCAINPLTAIHQIKNGALAADNYRHVIHAVCEEVVKVAATQHINLNLPEILNTVYQVIDNTADNFSSMNRDIAKQQKTEIQAINGYISHLAHQHEIASPMNQSLVEQIQSLEK